MAEKKTTLGLIIGNRGFFPTALCEKGREEMLGVLESAGYDYIVLSNEDSLFGSTESLEESRKCAALFDENRHKIDGIIITLPNFGEESAIVNALRWSKLDVPILVQAFPDDPQNMTIKDRRDSFCGKMSACNNMRQYGIPYTLTTLHTDYPDSPTFKQDLADFAATCRVVKKLRNCRIGALGARPAAFNTVRYSEKLLEESGVSVVTMDLFELFGWVGKMSDSDKAVQAKLAEIKAYVNSSKVKEELLLRMAKFGSAVDKWMADNALDATAIQCWTAMEEFFGIVPCTCMSMLSNKLLPSACEVDIMGTVGMVAMAEASGRPSALVDWNNNYGDDPDKGVLFHCSNLPKDVFSCEVKEPTMGYQEIIAGSVGADNTYGTIYGRVKNAPFTYLRVTTDDQSGCIASYIGEGEFTDDPLETFGGYGVFRVPNLQRLLHYICDNGFEHHTAINLSQCAAPISEAFTKYMGWYCYHHQG
ncbi:L-fucose/L-arabinose isomerase family protein [Candidatus Sumerlaeota bacterium]|nr:L-fucose/L-arabinose isomerase family protein [Candidatus Sumerlaeota bacterium]